jgi:rhamnosyltransferase subunit B
VAGIGRELRRRGHRVTLLANEAFRAVAERAGLEFVGVGSKADYQAAVNSPHLFGDQLKGFRVVIDRMIAPALRPLDRAIEERYVPGETVVAATSLAFGARIAQDRLGVPVVTLHLQPTLLPTAYDVPVLPGLPFWLKRGALPLVERMSDWIFAGVVNAARAEAGLAPVRGVMGRWGASPLRVLGLFPEWYAPPQADWPPQTRLTGFVRYDDGGVPDESSPALPPGEGPIVVFTAGTGMRHGGSFFEASTEACRRLGCRGLLLTRSREDVPPHLPRGVAHCAYAPFSALFPLVSAVVHHGGIGTAAQAFAAGVPQLVVPQSFDQPDTAARVRRLGTGLSLPAPRYTAEKAAAALSRLIEDPRFRERATPIAERMRNENGAVAACDAIVAAVIPGRGAGC